MLPAMDSRTVTITLQVRVEGDDVRGSARAVAAAGDAEAAEPRVFAGWLGLIGAIDALLGFPPDAGSGAGAAARAIAAQEGAPSR
jgi:hypothetical protein